MISSSFTSIGPDPLILKIDTLCQRVSLIFYFVPLSDGVPTSDGMITTCDAVREPSLFTLPYAWMVSPTARSLEAG